jgi:RNA polymerase primary sigma factor
MNKHYRDLLKPVVKAKIDQLPPRERHVLMLRFGLSGGEPASLKEIGAMFGITLQRTHQIETSALKRLKELV